MLTCSLEKLHAVHTILIPDITIPVVLRLLGNDDEIYEVIYGVIKIRGLDEALLRSENPSYI